MFGRAIFFVLLFETSMVSAQDEGAARAAFDEGQSHYDDGRFVLAAASFRRSYELAEGLATRPLILFNLARSLEQAPGNECEARRIYDQFIHDANGDDPEVQRRLRVVQERLRELSARIDAAGGCGGGAISPAGPIVMGVGGAALLVAVITGGVAAAEDGSLADTCGADGICPTSARAQADQIRALTIATDVLWVAGAAIAITGLVLTLVLREPAAETPVAAWLNDNGAGLVVRGRL